jgi:hypothetical protein
LWPAPELISIRVSILGSFRLQFHVILPSPLSTWKQRGSPMPARSPERTHSGEKSLGPGALISRPQLLEIWGLGDLTATRIYMLKSAFGLDVYLPLSEISLSVASRKD